MPYYIIKKDKMSTPNTKSTLAGASIQVQKLRQVNSPTITKLLHRECLDSRRPFGFVYAVDGTVGQDHGSPAPVMDMVQSLKMYRSVCNHMARDQKALLGLL